ncbi:hypothetical protein ACLESO_38120 [Pyxidicoccus sp. 3LG]
MHLPSTMESLSATLVPSGLNVFGVAEVSAYDAQVRPAQQSATVAPGARSILVVGSGGPALWHAFVADLQRQPRHLTHEPHPLEAFAQREVERADALPGDPPRRWFFAAADASVQRCPAPCPWCWTAGGSGGAPPRWRRH